MVILRDFHLIVHCLGWCHIMTTVALGKFFGDLQGWKARKSRRMLQSCTCRRWVFSSVNVGCWYQGNEVVIFKFLLDILTPDFFLEIFSNWTITCSQAVRQISFTMPLCICNFFSIEVVKRTNINDLQVVYWHLSSEKKAVCSMQNYPRSYGS